MRRTPTPKTAGEAKLAEFTAELTKGSLTGDLVPAGSGRSRSDVAFGDLIAIVKKAEDDVHRAQLRVYEGNIGVKLQAELDNARRQMTERQHVDPAVILEIARLGQEWKTKRNLTDTHGGGAS
jgi:hypothetical protein